MAMSKRPKGGKRSWSPSSEASRRASALSSPFGSSAADRRLRYALAFSAGLIVGALLAVWIAKPDGVVYVIDPKDIAT